MFIRDPLNAFEKIPESIESLLLEKENPPRLSFTKKNILLFTSVYSFEVSSVSSVKKNN